MLNKVGVFEMHICEIPLLPAVTIMVNKPWYVFANRPEHLRHPPESFNQLYRLLHFGFEPIQVYNLFGRYYIEMGI